jgi:uncharacterized protein
MECLLTSTEYTAALLENRLLGLKCRTCGTINVPPRMVCRKCTGTDLAIAEISGRGKIKTFTSICIAPERWRDKAPYLVVMVELDEGPWIMGNLAGVDPSTASMDLIDKRVEMGDRMSPIDESSAVSAVAPLFILEA